MKTKDGLFKVITPEMIRECEAHLPFDVAGGIAKWEWTANYLNTALAHPNVPCPCCGCTPAGEIIETTIREDTA